MKSLASLFGIVLAGMLCSMIARTAWAEDASNAPQPCSRSALGAAEAFLQLNGSGENGSLGQDTVASACSPYPGGKRQTLLAAAFGSGDGKDLFLAVIDDARRQVVASFQGFIDEDSATLVNSDSLHWKGRPLKLSAQNNTVALDVSAHRSQGCGNWWGALRTLYLRDGNKLRPVLPDVTMEYWQMVRGASCSPANDDIIEANKTTLSVLPSSTRGLRDVMVTVVSSRNDGKASRRPAFRYVLRYDGKQYNTSGLDTARGQWLRENLQP